MPGFLVEGPDDDLNFAPRGEQTDPLSEAVLEQEASAPAPVEASEPENDIPEKYRNKSATELLDIVRNQDSLIGRHSNELGDLRKRNGTLEGLVEKALSLRNPGDGREEAPTVEEDLSEADYRDDPVGATSRLAERTVEKHTAPLEQQIAQLNATAQLQSFERKYPTASTDINDEKFIEFATGSNYRKSLALKAFGNADKGEYDLAAAEELWEAWEEVKPSAEATSDPEPQQQAAPKAQPTQAPSPDDVSLVSGASSTGSGMSEYGKPQYSSQALQELQVTNPDYFWREDVQAKISLAYQEGRVS